MISESRIRYCHKCRHVSSGDNCCNYVCHVLIGGCLRPNKEYRPRTSYAVKSASTPYYCRPCRVGTDERCCNIHGACLIRYGDVYIPQRIHAQMTEDRLTDSAEYDYGIKVCNAFMKGEKPPELAELPLPQNKITVRDNTKVCIKCLRITNLRRCCGAYTKLPRDGTLVPDMSIRLRQKFINIACHGEYYCTRCRRFISETCDLCRKPASHRWFSGINSKGYLIVDDYNEIMATIVPSRDQVSRIAENFRFLVSEGYAPGITESMLPKDDKRRKTE